MKRRATGDRLRRAFGRDGGPESGGVAPGAAGGGVRDFLLRRRKERATGTLPADGVPLTNAAGECFLVRGEYPADHRHGQQVFPRAAELDWRRLADAAREPTLADARLEDCLFLDTETTGLSGGAGTTVFMTGLGFFAADGGPFVLEQLFLRGFADEPAMLTHVEKRLAERPILVTFVGKAFDRHRLAARMTLHRFETAILSPRHLDLYYLARRAWKDELPDVRLQTVERTKLGLVRDDDLPGREAPRVFTDWLRSGTGPVDRVFEHNRLDVLTLAALLGVLGAREGGRRVTD